MYNIYTYNNKKNTISIKRKGFKTKEGARAKRDELKGCGNTVIDWYIVADDEKDKFIKFLKNKKSMNHIKEKSGSTTYIHENKIYKNGEFEMALTFRKYGYNC